MPGHLFGLSLVANALGWVLSIRLAWVSCCRSSEKVGWWMHDEGKGSCPSPLRPPSYMGEFLKCVQFGAFLMTSATENVQIGV